MKTAEKTAKDLQNDMIEALKRGIADPTGKALNDAFELAVGPAGKVRKGLGKDLWTKKVGGDLYSEDSTILSDLYRFFAQALRGNNPKPEHGSFDGPMAREEIRAWNTMKNRTTRESQIEYICLVIQIAINFENSKELKEFCKHVYSKKAKFDELLKMPYKAKSGDLERMMQRRQYLEKCADPAADPSNVVTTLTPLTQKRLKTFGIDPTLVFTKPAAKSVLPTSAEIKKLADEFSVLGAIASDSKDASKEQDAKKVAIGYLPGFAGTHAKGTAQALAQTREPRKDSDSDQEIADPFSTRLESPSEVLVLADATSSGQAMVMSRGLLQA